MMAVRSNHRKNSTAGVLVILPIIVLDPCILCPTSDAEEEDIERIDLGKLRHIEEEERREQNG